MYRVAKCEEIKIFCSFIQKLKYAKIDKEIGFKLSSRTFRFWLTILYHLMYEKITEIQMYKQIDEIDTMSKYGFFIFF